MTKGIDCATPLTSALACALYADGFEFACRYLVPSGWKRLTMAEAEAISVSGLQIVSVFETMANRALAGRFAGLVDGKTATQVAKDVGQPAGSTIYFAVDFDALPAHMDLVASYIRAANEETPEYATGVYGSYAVIEAMKARGVCSRFWQTHAWSHGKKANGIHIYQHDCGPQGLGLPIHGISVDLNESYGNEGWWNTVGYKLCAEDANKVIGLLGKVWEMLPEKQSQEEIHRLANELRKASGQPEE